jgi:putative ABC transport system permease protein
MRAFASSMRSFPLFCAIACLASSGSAASLPANDRRSPPPGPPAAGSAGSAPRTITIDAALAAAERLHVGDRVLLSAEAGATGPDTVVIGAIVARSADPAAVARGEYRIRLHLDELQRLADYGSRVDRFAIRSTGGAAADTLRREINRVAFGFRAYPSAEIAVGTSRTFQVVRRFHRAIAVITIVASAVFLLCLLLLKVEERRRDVAALRLMGISRRTVVGSLVIEAAVVAVAGSALGVGVGLVGAALVNWHYQAFYRTPLVFALITPGTIVTAVGLSCVLGVAAGFLAALRLVLPPPLALFGR